MHHIATSVTRPAHHGAMVAILVFALISGLPTPTGAALTDLSTAPLQTATPVAKPNLLFILDDSGSMGWDFMPDWADTNTDSLARNSGFNATYYNPAIRYEPPIRADGSRYPSMTSGSTSAWRSVPFDGFGVQNARDTGNVLLTNGNSGTTQNLTNIATYYTFIPGEFCTDESLKTCVPATAKTTSHPFPALLRWCSNAQLTNCRATRIDSPPPGGLAFTRARAAGMGGVPGRNMRVDIDPGRTYAYPGIDEKAAGRSDCAGSQCTYEEEMTNFANWWAYYRTRMQMAKSAASLAFAEVDEKFRIGYMSINNNTGSDFLNVRNVDADPNGQKFQWYSKLLAARPGSSTPLRTALSTAGRYYANKSGNINNVRAEDPMQYACQRNYTMLSTDGYWNERNNPVGLGANNTTPAIGDVDGANGIERPYLDGTRTASTLADVALYFYATDLRANAFGNTVGALNQDVASNNVDDKQQRMYTSTIGLGASGFMQYQNNYDVAATGDYASITKGSQAGNGVCGWQTSGACTWPKVVSNEQTTIDDLWHAAVNGRGRYYSAASPIELRDGLQAFIQEAGRGGAVQVTSPAVSSLNLTKDDNLAFGSTYTANAWFGEVYAYALDPSTGKASMVNLWSQSEALPAGTNARTLPRLTNRDPATRQIYTAEFSSTLTAPKRIEFKWPAMGADTKRHFRIPAINTLSQFCTAGAGCLQAQARVDTDNAGAGRGVGGINLVNFLRGDRSLEGQDNISYYRKRTHVLGDIVNAQPVYVKKPLFNYVDTGYGQFKRDNAARQPMLYVGANDGMLHAFQAIDGVESWAYIPSMLLPNLHKLADKDYANRHQFYVNGSPRHGDIYHAGQWRTILVGGLGRGGRGYYALDITNAGAPPTVLWEFSHERSKGGGHIGDEDMGYSYGTPVITKLSDGTWVVIVTSGYNNLSPGSGRGIVWVLHAWTGQVISKIDTGAGGNAAQPGCDAGPCPAGLTHIKVYTDNGDRNNLGTRIYGGDLLGNVWRIDISQLKGTGGTATVTKLATLTAPASTLGAPEARQSVTAAPELGKVNNVAVVYIGTGRYLGLSDLGTTTSQSFYAIKDPLTAAGQQGSVHESPRAKTCTSPTERNCFVKQIYTDANGKRTASSTLKNAPVDFRVMNGWYVDLPAAGERLITEPELQLGVLAFVTSVPGAAEACKLGGTSYLNYVDYASGLALEGESDIGYRINTGIGTGVVILGLSDGRILIRPGGGKGPEDTATGQPTDPNNTKDGDDKIYKPKAGQGTRRISWRELITDQ